jgi:hypothetical protein
MESMARAGADPLGCNIEAIGFHDHIIIIIIIATSSQYRFFTTPLHDKE